VSIKERFNRTRVRVDLLLRQVKCARPKQAERRGQRKDRSSSSTTKKKKNYKENSSRGAEERETLPPTPVLGRIGGRGLAPRPLETDVGHDKETRTGE